MIAKLGNRSLVNFTNNPESDFAVQHAADRVRDEGPRFGFLVVNVVATELRSVGRACRVPAKGGYSEIEVDRGTGNIPLEGMRKVQISACYSQNPA
jgi:hypothetical protein